MQIFIVTRPESDPYYSGNPLMYFEDFNDASQFSGLVNSQREEHHVHVYRVDVQPKGVDVFNLYKSTT